MSKEDTKCFGKLKVGGLLYALHVSTKILIFYTGNLQALMFFVIKVICTATCKSVVRLLLYELKRLFLVVGTLKWCYF